MTLHQRELSWEGCFNVRDLGGHTTEDGGETRYGAVLRADSIRLLSDAGWQAAVDYGVRTVVDLRDEHELHDDPPAQLPVEVVHVPFFGGISVSEESDAVAASAPDVASAVRDIYLVWLERFRENVAAAIRAVATAPDGIVVVHCVGGKDRTGLVTALLLRLAGVDTEQIGADYALSEIRLRPRHDRWFAEATTDVERAHVQRISQTPAAAIVGVLEELDRRSGSVADYLRAGGLRDQELELARARLRD